LHSDAKLPSVLVGEHGLRLVKVTTAIAGTDLLVLGEVVVDAVRAGAEFVVLACGVVFGSEMPVDVDWTL